MNQAKTSNSPRILIVKPSSFGDVIHALPLARAIKQAASESVIDWVVFDNYADLVRLSPYVDNIIAIKREQWAIWRHPSSITGVATFAADIRRHEYDAVLDLQGLLRSGMITPLARAPLKIGFSNAREGAPFFYTLKAQAPEGSIHAVDRYMSMLVHIGINPNTEVEYGLQIPRSDIEWAKEATGGEPFVALSPNSRWPTKLWPVEKFGELSKRLYKERGLKTVVIGGPDDIDRGREVVAASGGLATDLSGRAGIGQLAAILSICEGAVTNDSGPMHLAAAVGARVTAIFGPTDPRLTGPYGKEHKVARVDIDCSPCFKRSCPLSHECMRELTVDALLSLSVTTELNGAGTNG